MKIEEVTRAIVIVEDSRETHLKWIHYLNHPEATPVHEDVGDIDHHTKAVQGYDHVLYVLIKLKEFMT